MTPKPWSTRAQSSTSRLVSSYGCAPEKSARWEQEATKRSRAHQLRPLEVGVERRGRVCRLHRAQVVHEDEQHVRVVHVLAVCVCIARR